MLRKGRNALSTFTHFLLNICLAIASTALTIISGNWIFGFILVLLSKWRVIAVRPRYWWLNIKANIVDFAVGLSLTYLIYAAGTDALNAWHILLTAFYIAWLVIIKPQSETIWTEVQAFFAIFFGTFAISVATTNVTPLIGIIVCFIIGYGASRHVLIQGDDHDYTLTTFIFGLLLGELYWIFYHWTIIYQLGTVSKLYLPQLPIASSLLSFVFFRGYKSAVYHDGKIRVDDILLPAIFSALLMFVMIFFFSEPRFNV